MPRNESTTPDERAVRHALAAARHTEPMPDEVAGRLDALLGELAAERSNAPADPTTSTPATVTALTPRPRSRWRVALVAAAAVVVAGATAPAWWPEDTAPEATQVHDTAQGTADSLESGAEAGSPRTSPSPGPAAASRATPGDDDRGQATKDTPQQDGVGASQSLPELLQNSTSSAGSSALLTSRDPLRPQVIDLLGTAGTAGASAGKACRPAALSGPRITRALPARLDDTPVWVLEKATGSGQVALVVNCSGAVIHRFPLT